MMRNHHLLVVCFPAVGHINPSLQLAKRLASLGLDVTFATTALATRRIIKTQPTSTTTTQGLSFATFSDGFDDSNIFKLNDDMSHYFSQLKRCGSQSLTDLILSLANKGRPITFLIYSPLLTWAADVATAFHIPSILFFVQPATLLALYYYYFHGYGDSISNLLNSRDPSLCIELPGLPLLTSRDMPSFLSPSSPHASILPPIMDQIEFLDGQKSQTKVLVNTFEALEKEALRAMDCNYKLKMLAIGPLIPHDLLSLEEEEEEYIQWLNSKPNSSVVYISFGSMCELSSQQKDEIMHALLDSGHMFLWVIRSKDDKDDDNNNDEQGKIVSWCNQFQVLTHPSLGCFMTHCGWNSTIETLALGLPVVAFPQQMEQATNAKLVEEVWKTGVKVKANTEGIVEREEIRRCLDIVMGGQNKEIEENAKHWKTLAKQAVAEGGSSYLNLKTFIAQMDDAISFQNETHSSKS